MTSSASPDADSPPARLPKVGAPVAAPARTGALAALRMDWRANSDDPKALFVLTFFRIANLFSRQKKARAALYYLGAPILIAYKLIVGWLLGIDIPSSTKIGPGLRLLHGQTLVINKAAVIGANCTLRHATTIGAKILRDGRAGASPVLMDNVNVGSNAVIIGDIVIGEHAVVGAGAVVTKSVPAHAVVVGNPARIIGDS